MRVDESSIGLVFGTLSKREQVQANDKGVLCLARPF